MKQIDKFLKSIREGALIRKIKSRVKKRIFYKRVKKHYNDDKKYLTDIFKFNFGKEPNLDKPQSYNEKLLWLKLYWRDERAYQLVDKYEVRDHLKEIGLEKHLIPLFCVAEKLEDINFIELPEEFIIKTTHDSGGTFIVTNKNNKKMLNEAKKKISKALKKGAYNESKEWVYDKVKPRIIVEKLIKDPIANALIDYKFFCFNGKAQFLFVGTERDIDVKFDFFDLNWNWLDVRNGHENNKNRPLKPKNFEKMILIAEKASKGFPHVRVDLYNIEGEIFFGEMTFFHFGGQVPFDPPSFDYLFGEYLNLPTK